MCGIVGIIGSFDKAEGESLLEKMLEVIEHRGPDSHGKWSTNGFAFGMQRLSIIDVSGGDQPIWTNHNEVGIIFNGEIYNFKNLRNDLIKEGIIFKTHSDTEVILQLYIQKGLEAIHQLEGMFGICLYDARIQKLYLIRDRLGVKPLYYFCNENQFVFASEIKSILAVLPKKPALNEQSISDYLTLRYVPAPETIWQEIRKLEPGHWLEYNFKTKIFNKREYWSVNFNSEKIQKNKNYEQEFENLFLGAVEKHLVAADVPVGILLSGGLDSSCVVAAAVELGHKNFHTFSVGFEENEFNELQYAREVAYHVGSQHHEIIVSQKQFIDFFEKFVWYSDEPLADLASIPLYYVSKLASQHVKVVLSGEGSDEILAGYNLDQLAHKLFYLKLADILPKFLLKLLPQYSFKILSESGYHDFLKYHPSYISSVFSEAEKEKICNFKRHRSTKDYIQNLYNLSSSLEPIDQLQQAYCHSWLVEDLLMKADKMTMATSLELRVPFLDYKLVEWAARLPLKWKVGDKYTGFLTKKILRKFAEKRLPKKIMERPKQGFPVPAYQWLRKDLMHWAEKKLNSAYLDNYLNRNEIEKILADVKTGSLSAVHKIWSVLVFNEWLQRWAA